MTTNRSIDFFAPKYQTANKEKNNESQENQSNQNDNNDGKEKEKQNDNGKHNGWDKNTDKGSANKGNNGLHLGWYKRADYPKNPANTGALNNPSAYEIINYINDVSLNNAEVLMTSDREGKYNTAYTYGLERISVDNLNVEDSFKEEPLFYLYDGRGNTTELTDNRGVARDRYRYDPYGVPIPKATIGPNPWYTDNPYRYKGEDYDIDTGLQYLRARYYEPSTGRFLSRDSYLGNVMEPLTLNRYAYVSNNPIMYDDPTGHSSEKVINWLKGALDIGKKVIDNVTTFISEVSTNLNNAVDNFVDIVSGFISGNSSNGYGSDNTSGEQYISDSKRDSKSSNSKNNNKNKNNNTYKPKNFIEERLNQIQVNAKKDCTGLEKVSKQDAKVYASGVSESTAVIRAMTPTEKLKDGLSDLIPFVPGLNLINDVKVATTGIDVTGRAYFNDEIQDAKVSILLDVGLSVTGMSAASIDEAAKVADDAIEELSQAGQKILKNLDEGAAEAKYLTSIEG